MTEAKTRYAIEAIDPDHWRRLCGDRDPFMDHRYLEALEATGCVGPTRGWQPRHIVVGDDRPTAVLPLYLKHHSYGEYVFDWGWARAAQASGIDYYPKLVTAVPFTPATGPRLGADGESWVAALLEGVAEEAAASHASSWHLLFADDHSIRLIHSGMPAQMPLIERHDCQFRWQNRGYRDFDDYLDRFVSRKRKGIRRERRRVREQGVTLVRLGGPQIDHQALTTFYQFHALTYARRGQRPYLTPAFFQRLAERMPERLMMVIASTPTQAVGCALFLRGEDTLYGRWWGGDPSIDCLHFEACYYQGIEYAIEQGLRFFDPGTQGEHKLLRGFEPVISRSLHWIAEPALADAVARWVDRERHQIRAYYEEAREYLPFKAEAPAG